MLFHLTVESGQMDLYHSEVCSSHSSAVCHFCKDSNPKTLAHLFILYHHRKLVTSLCPQNTDDRRHCCKMLFSRSAQLSIRVTHPQDLNQQPVYKYTVQRTQYLSPVTYITQCVFWCQSYKVHSGQKGRLIKPEDTEHKPRGSMNSKLSWTSPLHSQTVLKKSWKCAL